MNCFILGKECIINLFVGCILAALLSFKSSEESKVQYSGQSAGIYPMFWNKIFADGNNTENDCWKG